MIRTTVPLEESLLDRLLVATVGPVVTAVVGTLIIGLFAQWITRRTQDRRAALSIRQELISELTEVAGSAFLALVVFERATDAELAAGRIRLRRKAQLRRRLEGARDQLEEHHFESRVRGWVLESRLQVYYGTHSTPAKLWHRTLDCLNVHYLLLTDQLTSSAPDYMNMSQHTLLNEQQMRDRRAVRERYEASLPMTISAILRDRMRIPPLASPR